MNRFAFAFAALALGCALEVEPTDETSAPQPSDALRVEAFEFDVTAGAVGGDATVSFIVAGEAGATVTLLDAWLERDGAVFLSLHPDRATFELPKEHALSVGVSPSEAAGACDAPLRLRVVLDVGAAVSSYLYGC